MCSALLVLTSFESAVISILLISNPTDTRLVRVDTPLPERTLLPLPPGTIPLLLLLLTTLLHPATWYVELWPYRGIDYSLSLPILVLVLVCRF